MNCAKAKKRIPLFVGRELAGKKAAKVGAHLAKCTDCRREAEELDLALKAVKGLALSDKEEDWSETEWRNLMISIATARVEKKKAWTGSLLKPALAGALVLVFVIAGAFLIFKKTPAKIGAQAAQQSPSQNIDGPVQPPGNQDIISMTIVSKETGLKITWFFNKNFEGEKYGK